MTSIKDLFQYSHFKNDNWQNEDDEYVFNADNNITIQICDGGSFFSVNQWNEDEGTQTHHKIFDHLGNAMNYVINVVDKGETLCR